MLASAMSESYDVDPGGDLKIVLSLLAQPFAPCKCDKELLPKSNDGEEAHHIGNVSSATQDESLPHTPDQPPELVSKVSSKHLTLASRRFKKMLGGDWIEARTFHPDGCRHVNMEGLDPTALKILMNIIHGKTRKVPRSVDLELLAKIAVVVDDLECLEEVELFADMWLEGKSIPDEMTRDLIMWILISATFQQHELLRQTTRTAILCGTGPFESLGLPIPIWIIGEWLA